MRIPTALRVGLIAALALAGVHSLPADQATPSAKPNQAKKRLLLITESKGFVHDVVKRKVTVAKDLDPKNLPKEFSRLEASEIEDCLCIYKSELRGGVHGQVSSRKVGCGVAIRPRICL